MLGLLLNFWQDAKNPRGVWRTTSLESYQEKEPSWSVLLDLDELAVKEGRDFVWGSATTLPKSHARAIVGLSESGSDAVELREFDVKGKAFVKDGFRLPAVRSVAEWLDRNTLLLMSSLGDGAATRSGYTRTIRLWSRGTNIDQLPTIFEVPDHYIGVWASVVANREPETILYRALPSFYEREYSLGDRAGPQIQLDLPRNVDAGLQGDRLLVRSRDPLEIGGATHKAGSLLAIQLTAFLAGDRNFVSIFTPNDKRVLQGWTWAGDEVVLSILDDLRPVFQSFAPGDTQPKEITGLPNLGVVQIERFDQDVEESDGALIAKAQDPITPPTFLLKSPATANWKVLKQAPQAFRTDGLVCSRHEAISTDGERIPYMQIGPVGSETGNAPVHLFGYGGFESPALPGYRTEIGKLWLERGGTSVIANIRGGGEFGPRWHEAGRREGKRLSHDDFAAVASDLVARGVTHPKRIAAEGASNGGLLISNMFVRYPERFGALFCAIPLIDLRRYSKLLVGASWIAELGDPDIAEDWAFMKTFSPHQMAEPPRVGKSYPPILMATTRRDDRVHPGHARKMAAKLQTIGHNAYYYEASTGGHGYGRQNSERATFVALGFQFLRHGIGWQK